jgi:hypothetical protein
MALRITPTVRVEKDYPWIDSSRIVSAVQDPSRFQGLLADLTRVDSTTANDLSQTADQFLGGEFGNLDLYERSTGTAYAGDSGDSRYERHSGTHPGRIDIGDVRVGLATSLWDRLRGLRAVEDEPIIIRKQVPLFIFNSPKLPDAKTTYGEDICEEGGLGWKIEILGTGYGADVTVAVTNTNEFVSTSGARKLAFAPLNVQVTRVSLYRQGEFQRCFLRVELAETETREANGLRSVGAEEWRKLTSNARVVDRFDLSGDTSGSSAKYVCAYSMKGSFEWKLGLKISELEASVTAKCQAAKTAEATFDLPAGKMYTLWTPSSISGFFF